MHFDVHVDVYICSSNWWTAEGHCKLQFRTISHLETCAIAEKVCGAAGCSFTGFRSPNGYAISASQRTDVALLSSTFLNNRAAIFLPSDEELILQGAAMSASSSSFTRGSTVTAKLYLQNVTFSGSTPWSATNSYRGGGDISAYDYPVVYSDKDLAIPHQCHTGCNEQRRSKKSKKTTAASFPLACAASAFLTGHEDWLSRAQQVCCHLCDATCRTFQPSKDLKVKWQGNLFVDRMMQRRPLQLRIRWLGQPVDSSHGRKTCSQVHSWRAATFTITSQHNSQQFNVTSGKKNWYLLSNTF